MAISQNKYINIISAVSNSDSVRQRDLIARVFTDNILVPVGSIVEFSGGATVALEQVGDYFGLSSAEYRFASRYFQPNKKGVAPRKIGFSGYTGVATPATMIGKKGVTLSEIRAVTAGTFSMNIISGETTTPLSYSDINLSAVTSLAGAAEALNAIVSNDGITFSYDAVLGRFYLQTVATGDGLGVSPAAGTLAVVLGMTQAEAQGYEGADAMTAVETVANATEISNNFFSFCFLPDLTYGDLQALAQWTSAQNVKYMFSVQATASNVRNIVSMVEGNNGVAVTLDQYNADGAFMPMSRIASIDYNKPNAAISMFYQQFEGVSPSVADTKVATTLDGLKVNYYGQTSQAGQNVSFYQNGVLQGQISDMGVYANEAWLKDSFVAGLLNLRLALDTLPANNTGIGLVLATLMDTVNLSIYNGVTLPGKTLTTTDKAYITQLTGDENAWMRVQSAGYYITADLEKDTVNGVEQYKASFLYIYGKGDSINYVDGRDILI